MQFIIIILMSSLVASQYLRELYDHNDNYGFDDLNKLSTLIQKKPEIIYVKPESCTTNKCRVKLSETFDMLINMGYGASFKLTHSGLMNTTMDLFLKQTNFNITPNYLYTTTMSKIYYRIAFKNYDSTKYSNCINNVGDDDFTTIADVMISGVKGKDWDYSFRKSQTYDLGPLSASAIKCGHYWPTTLTTCIEKAVITRLDKGIATFKLSEEVNIDFTISLMLNNVQYDYKFAGDFNQPQIWQMKENFAVEINPLGTVISPISGFISCIFMIKGDKIPTKCYLSNTVPDKGSPSSNSIGKFQLISFNNPDKLMFDKNNLIGDLLYPCSESKYKLAKVKGYKNNELKTKIFEIYNLKKSDQQDDRIIVDFNLKDTGLETLQLGDTCCVKLTSPTDLFLENSVASLEDIRETFKTKMITNISNIVITSSGVPRLDSLNFKNLMRPKLTVSILSDGLDIELDKREFELKNVKIPKMVYFPYAAGSYMQLSFEFIGHPQNIKIDSSDINILTKELYVHKPGLVEELVGFKSVGYMREYPVICVGDNNNCLKPESIEEKQPKEGIVDDNEEVNGEYIDRTKTFLWKLFTGNWIIAVISGLVAVLEIIISLIIIVMIYKLTRKFFTVLCCVAAVKESNAFITSKMVGSFPDKVFLETSTYDYHNNVGTIYSMSNERAIINAIINNSKGIRVISCAQFDPSTTKEVECNSYCFTNSLKRTMSVTKEGGSLFVKGDVWSSDAVNYRFDGSNKLVSIKDHLFENVTTDNNKKCRDSWESITDKTKMFWLKETVLEGYRGMFGYSTIKLIIPQDSKTSYVFEIVDYLTAYDGYDILAINKFGKKNNYHAISVTTVSDASIDADDKITDLRNVLSLPKEVIIHTIKSQTGNYITRNFYLIQCEDRCVIYDPTTTSKNKEIILSKYIPIIDNESVKRRVMNNLVDICKKIKNLEAASGEHMVEDVKVVKLGNKTTHFKFNNGKNTYILLTSNLKDTMDTNCNFKARFDKIYSKGYHYSNFLITNDNIHPVKRGGPISINCINTGFGSYCKHLNNEMTAFINDESTNDVSLRSIKFKGMVYSYSIGDYVEHISPTDDECKGKVMVDSNSNAICSHDCCLVSETYWQTYSLFKANNKYKLSGTPVFSQWKEQKKAVFNFKNTKWCDYNGFSNSVRCLWYEYKMEITIVFFLPLMLIITYYLIILIYYSIIWCVSKNPKRDRKYLNRRYYGNNKWFFTNMADNILKGKPKFWKYDELKDSEEELRNLNDTKRVYKRTVKPVC
ncbi:glycoprotein [Guagua virus]|uniref:Glycoprotein n=1 Tax=Guagua virus TaxID=2689370 RepID=A0A6B9KU61_9VIRU|nr:glycoprotein [Guagua virus]QHA33857.1 glycoprotein [Guagua virus]